MKLRKINQNKKGLSEMISYVLLVAIAIGISTGVFVWLKSFATVNPVVDCEEGTSVLMDSYTCECNAGLCLINLKIKNNGRFNVSGIMLTVSNDSKKEPIYYLISQNDTRRRLQGFNYFDFQLNPGSIDDANFLNELKDGDTINSIAIIQIQPFIMLKKNRVVCQNSIIKQPIENCNFP